MSEDRKHHFDEWSLQEYLDDVLADDSRERLEVHLTECDDCAEKFASLKHLYSEMERLRDEPLAHDLSVRIIRSLTLNEGRKSYLHRVLAAQLAAAIIVLLAIWPRISLEFGSKYSLVQLLVPLRIFVDLSTRGIILVTEFLNWFYASWTASLSMPTINWPITGLPLASAVCATILVWLLGNGLLLRQPANGQIQQ